jgi:hypothetical protein
MTDSADTFAPTARSPAFAFLQAVVLILGSVYVLVMPPWLPFDATKPSSRKNEKKNLTSLFARLNIKIS